MKAGNIVRLASGALVASAPLAGGDVRWCYFLAAWRQRFVGLHLHSRGSLGRYLGPWVLRKSSIAWAGGSMILSLRRTTNHCLTTGSPLTSNVTRRPSSSSLATV